jgi:outer membrane protein TolC
MLRLEATRGYHSYRLAIRSEAVLRDTQRLLAVIVTSVNARYRVGRAELTELLKAQEALASLENELLDVARERDLTVAGLNTLLDRPPREPLGTPITEPVIRPLPEETALTARALAARPERRTIQAQITQAQARARAARVERSPDLAVWGSFMAMLRGGADHTFSVGVQTSLPSWSLSRSGAAEREAWAQAIAEQERLRQLEAQIRGEMHAAYLRAETAARHTRLHAESILPLSERAVRAAQAGDQGGRVELVLLLDTARTFAMHHLEYERYMAEYGQRLAELEAALGGPLWDLPAGGAQP